MIRPVHRKPETDGSGEKPDRMELDPGDERRLEHRVIDGESTDAGDAFRTFRPRWWRGSSVPL